MSDDDVQADEPSPYMTVPEVARYLRLNDKTVYEMVDRGVLTYVRAGVVKGIRITRASVEALQRGAGVDDPRTATG